MKLKRFIIALIVLLVIAIPVLGTDLYWMWIPFLSHTEEYPIKLTALFMALSALITLLLAFTAVRTIEESNKREQRGKIEHQQKEKRDREERILDDVIQWAIDIHGCIFTQQVPPTLNKETRRAALGNLLQGYQYFAVRKRYIEGAASVFGLHDKVKVITDKEGSLQKFTDTVIKYMDDPSISKEYTSIVERLLNDANDLLESATRIKTGMITKS